MSKDFSRRQALNGLAIGAAAVSTRASAEDLHQAQPAVEVQQPAALQPQGVCTLFPQAVEGPYYFDPKLVRTDITEGRVGLPLTLHLRFIAAGSCAPLPKVRVDIWHADAEGVYSGYAGQGDGRDVSTKGKTYLRGTQMTDDNGSVTYNTVFPGWYPGRTPHIHIKAFLDDVTMLTGQAYFADEVASRIYRSAEPYRARPTPDTTNATDGIYRSGMKDGGGIVFLLDETVNPMTAGLLIAVDRSGAAARNAAGWRGMLRGLWNGGR